jgi:hypothetical protein
MRKSRKKAKGPVTVKTGNAVQVPVPQWYDVVIDEKNAEIERLHTLLEEAWRQIQVYRRLA